jgi:CRISPR/Cas system endoribonuclease Cas6 (RAMP superfamily)
MQFEIQLTLSKGRCFLRFNYQYELSQAIFSLLGNAEPRNNFRSCPKRLGDEGSGGGSFTFSQLKFDAYSLHQRDQKIEHTGQHATLQIRSADDNATWGSIKKKLLEQRVVLGDMLYQVSKNGSSLRRGI